MADRIPVVTAINPYDRLDWFLENLVVITLAALLIITYRRFQFSNISYFSFTVFITLHLIGAHYTYSETPLGYRKKACLNRSAIAMTDWCISRTAC